MYVFNLSWGILLFLSDHQHTEPNVRNYIHNPNLCKKKQNYLTFSEENPAH